MKRALLGVLFTAIVLSMCAATAFAAPGGGRYYADADGDGLCDVCGLEHSGCPTGKGAAFTDADGDGLCDNCGAYHRCGMAGAGCGSHFVDADGDGVCDNRPAGRGCGYGRGALGGRRNGFRGGRGK